MKNRNIWIYPSIVALAIFALTPGCKEEEYVAPLYGLYISTNAVSNISQTSAICGGYITTDTVGEVLARGVCWSTSQNPTIAGLKTSDGSGVGSFTSHLTDLSANKKYYVRAYAVTGAKIYYGYLINFRTPYPEEPVTDIDGNVYNTITIGTQTWMTENLKTTRYRNGDTIPNITNLAAWTDSTTGAFCSYDNNQTNAATYGFLYNWYAAVDSGNIAPVGWHVPSDEEWDILTTYLGGEDEAGEKLIIVGFIPLPGGCIYNGTFSFLNNFGYFWSTTESSPIEAGYLYTNCFCCNASTSYYLKNSGFSIRCVKD